MPTACASSAEAHSGVAESQCGELCDHAAHMGVKRLRISADDFLGSPPANPMKLAEVGSEHPIAAAGQREPQAHIGVPLVHRAESLRDGEEEGTLARLREEDRRDTKFLHYLASYSLHRVLARLDVTAGG